MLHVCEDTNNDHDANNGNFCQFFSQKKHGYKQYYGEYQSDDVEAFKKKIQDIKRRRHYLLFRHHEKCFHILDREGEKLNNIMSTLDRTMRTTPKTKLA